MQTVKALHYLKANLNVLHRGTVYVHTHVICTAKQVYSITQAYDALRFLCIR